MTTKPAQPVPIRFAGDGVGVEVQRLSALRERMGPRLHRPERLDFTLFVVPTAGEGVHTVDFVDRPCRPGRLIRVAPGRVHRFQTDATFEADLLLVHPRALTQPVLGTEAGHDLDDDDARTLATLLALLDRLLAAGEVNVAAVRALVAAWVAVTDRLPGPPRPVAGPHAERAHAFTELLEEHYAAWRRTEHYAAPPSPARPAPWSEPPSRRTAGPPSSSSTTASCSRPAACSRWASRAWRASGAPWATARPRTSPPRSAAWSARRPASSVSEPPDPERTRAPAGWLGLVSRVA